MKKISIVLGLIASAVVAWAGNPDRQGEAGAYELLLNPWARSAGLHGLCAANVSGIDAMRINPAGLGAMTSDMRVAVGHSQYLVGTSMSMNALGFAKKFGKKSTLGVEIMNLDFGNIPVTTNDRPEGTGITFSPLFLNLGLTYCYAFEEKIYTAITARFISEQLPYASAAGVAFDAGIQYHTGANKEIKIGIALRNIGTKMNFGGDGLSQTVSNPNANSGTDLITLDRRSQGFELPTQMLISTSYDFFFGNAVASSSDAADNVKLKPSIKEHRLTALGSFIANSFSNDQYGIGAEYGYKEMFMARVGYKYENSGNSDFPSTLDAGLSAGATIQVPLNMRKTKYFGFDYSYRTSAVWSGTHNISLRIDL
jgi:opacity protein-like surface antigen